MHYFSIFDCHKGEILKTYADKNNGILRTTILYTDFNKVIVYFRTVNDHQFVTVRLLILLQKYFKYD